MKGELKEASWVGELFFQEKPVKTLIFLRKRERPAYQSVISKAIDATYAHTLKILNTLHEKRLIKFEKVGRTKLVKLSEFGVEVSESLLSFIKALKLASIAQRVEELYSKEVKGKLRVEMRKEKIRRESERLKEELAAYLGDPSKNLALLARRIACRIDEMLTEASGLPLAESVPLEQ
jgi:hypothetical protein